MTRSVIPQGDNSEIVPVEVLAQALRDLGKLDYPKLSTWPLFTARAWSPGQEQRAWRRYRSGLCNLEEVACPRLYWRGLSPLLQQLFGSLTLGQSWGSSQPAANLEALFDSQGRPHWRVIPRFGRYILASRPDQEGDRYVYFGDDTLYLMSRGREILQSFETQRLRVLDLCCGGGGVGLALPPFEGELTGVDINPNAIALANLAAQAQGLNSYRYHLGSVEDVLEGDYDLVLGNPPSLPPETGARSTVYASGESCLWLDWLEMLQARLSATGHLLVTVFAVADGPTSSAKDSLRQQLAQRLCRRYRYRVRRQFPLPGGRWLRHVALELLPQQEGQGEEFVGPRSDLQLPGLGWRRGAP